MIAVGSHAHVHVSLTSLEETQLAAQLEASKDILRNHGVNPANMLAFPFGDFNAKVVSISKRLGYDILIGAGSIQSEFADQVFPRVGILNLGSLAFNILSINRAFRRFGF